MQSYVPLNGVETCICFVIFCPHYMVLLCPLLLYHYNDFTVPHTNVQEIQNFSFVGGSDGSFPRIFPSMKPAGNCDDVKPKSLKLRLSQTNCTSLTGYFFCVCSVYLL